MALLKVAQIGHPILRVRAEELTRDELLAPERTTLVIPTSRMCRSRSWSIPRFAEIRLTGWDREGRPLDRTIRGLTAGTFQHEADHLDGVIFVDRVADPKAFCTWAEFDRYHRKAFVDRILPFIERMGG